jgi:predicted TIM-barrel fold metal-dependent hydrolase
MHDGLLVIDADSHKIENPVVFFDYLDAPYRHRLSLRRDRCGQQRLVIRDFNPRSGRNDLERVFPQPDGPGKGAFAAFHPQTFIGALFNRIRIEHMDREGIDAQIIYGSLTLAFQALLDRDLAVACMRAYNSYIADDCRPHAGRLFPAAYLCLADPIEAARELRRCAEDLGMVAAHVAPSLPMPHPSASQAFPEVRLPKHFCHPDFDPIFRAAAELDIGVGIHGSPGVYLPGGASDQFDTFLLSHVFGHRNQMQMALAAGVFSGFFDRFPTLRVGFLEAGCGWVPDLVHTFREHWEKRIRDFRGNEAPSRMLFLRELVRERSGAGARRDLVRKAAGVLRLLARTDRQASRPEEAYLVEHPELRRDPTEFFSRGQIFFTFEPEDAAPRYLETALGEIGRRLCCLSVDYGHWDGVLDGCVRMVGERGYQRAHLGALLADNCLRFYGPRLASRARANSAAAGTTGA